MSGATVVCARCGESKPRLERPPQPGAFGRELQERVCGDCWREWQAMEVMVINELRLNFMDPGAQQVLDGHARKFFFLDGDEGGDAAMPVPDEKDR